MPGMLRGSDSPASQIAVMVTGCSAVSSTGAMTAKTTVARILRSVETQRQRVVAAGERRRGIGIGGIDRHAPRDGLRKCQRDLRDLFAQIVFRNAYFQHVNFVAELELHRLAGVVLLQSRGLDRDRPPSRPSRREPPSARQGSVGGWRAVAFRTERATRHNRCRCPRAFAGCLP